MAREEQDTTPVTDIILAVDREKEDSIDPPIIDHQALVVKKVEEVMATVIRVVISLVGVRLATTITTTITHRIHRVDLLWSKNANASIHVTIE